MLSIDSTEIDFEKKKFFDTWKSKGAYLKTTTI